MIHSLKAEFRKLLTVRSTYWIFAISVGLAAVLIGFWIFGYRNVEHAELNHAVLFGLLFSAVNTAGVFLSFIAVMLVGHEYRHNTIMYSLTNVNSRAKVFFAKYLALVGFALAFATLVVILCWLLFYLGLRLHGTDPVAQHVPLWPLLWRSVVTIVADVSYAFIITFLVRNIIAAVVVVLLLPSTIENLLVLLLKENTKYLPYTALGNLTSTGSKISYLFSLKVILAYIIVGGVVAYLLFQKRDAN